MTKSNRGFSKYQVMNFLKSRGIELQRVKKPNPMSEMGFTHIWRLSTGEEFLTLDGIVQMILESHRRIREQEIAAKPKRKLWGVSQKVQAAK